MLSHDVWKIAATSLQLSRFARAPLEEWSAKNHRDRVVCECFPSHHGTLSTVTSHDAQFTRRMRYAKNTAIPHNGTYSNRRSG